MTAQRSEATVPQWTLGDRLRKAREHAAISSQQMADALDLSRNSITNYEHGRTRPSTLVLRAWALATGVPLEWLRTGSMDTRQYHRPLALVA